MAEPKTYTIAKTRRGRTTETTNTLPNLINYFKTTLVDGNSYDSKVNTEPKTVKGLVSALNRATDSLQRGSYDPNYYELVTA
jgi:hypothetical protein